MSVVNAKRFLEELVKHAPFKITSVQVNGRSEFMTDFKSACQDMRVQLFVLPPRRPQWNGGVKRGNRTFREEFYGKIGFIADSIGVLTYELKTALHKYNNFRPYQSLKGATPMKYSHLILRVAA